MTTFWYSKQQDFAGGSSLWPCHSGFSGQIINDVSEGGIIQMSEHGSKVLNRRFGTLIKSVILQKYEL